MKMTEVASGCAYAIIINRQLALKSGGFDKVWNNPCFAFMQLLAHVPPTEAIVKVIFMMMLVFCFVFVILVGGIERQRGYIG